MAEDEDPTEARQVALLRQMATDVDKIRSTVGYMLALNIAVIVVVLAAVYAAQSGT